MNNLRESQTSLITRSAKLGLAMFLVVATLSLNVGSASAGLLGDLTDGLLGGGGNGGLGGLISTENENGDPQLGINLGPVGGIGIGSGNGGLGVDVSLLPQGDKPLVGVGVDAGTSSGLNVDATVGDLAKVEADVAASGNQGLGVNVGAQVGGQSSAAVNAQVKPNAGQGKSPGLGISADANATVQAPGTGRPALDLGLGTDVGLGLDGVAAGVLLDLEALGIPVEACLELSLGLLPELVCPMATDGTPPNDGGPNPPETGNPNLPEDDSTTPPADNDNDNQVPPAQDPGDGTAAGQVPRGGRLPLTGTSTALVVSAAAILLAAGVLLSALGRKPADAQ